MHGVVRRGAQRSRLQGWPTADLELGPQDVVGDGVWGGLIRLDTRVLAAVVSVGNRLDDAGGSAGRLLEAHLLDFAEDIYGCRIDVALPYFLRPHQPFENASSARRIRLDVDEVRRWSRRFVTHSRGDVAARREWHRSRRIVAAVREESRSGSVTYDAVATLAEVPVGHLRHIYPNLSDLASAGALVLRQPDLAG